MSKAETLIPANVQAFAAEFTELARKHGLQQAAVTLRFGFNMDRVWDDPINIVWEDGRHGEDARRFSVSTTLSIHRDLAKDPIRPAPTGGTHDA